MKTFNDLYKWVVDKYDQQTADRMAALWEADAFKEDKYLHILLMQGFDWSAENAPYDREFWSEMQDKLIAEERHNLLKNDR